MYFGKNGNLYLTNIICMCFFKYNSPDIVKDMKFVMFYKHLKIPALTFIVYFCHAIVNPTLYLLLSANITSSHRLRCKINILSNVSFDYLVY